MPPLELHPRLPQELHDKILAYVVKDETVGLEVVVNKGNIITDINYDYHSSNLKKLMDDEDVRDQLQPLIYEHAILDLSRSDLLQRTRINAVCQNIIRTKFHHFRRVQIQLHRAQRPIGELFENIKYLRLISAPVTSVVREGHWVVLEARVGKTHFPLSQQAVVEVVMEPYYRSSNWKTIPPFRVLPDAARDEEAQKWYAQELKDAMTSLAG